MEKPGVPGLRVRGLGVAVFAFLGQLGAAVPGLWGADGFALGTWLLVVAPLALATTVALWVTVVPRGGARAAVWCAAAAAASLVIFRLGLTLPLAGAALVLGREAPLDDPEHERLGWLAMAMAGFVLLATAVLVVVDVLG